MKSLLHSLVLASVLFLGVSKITLAEEPANQFTRACNTCFGNLAPLIRQHFFDQHQLCSGSVSREISQCLAFCKYAANQEVELMLELTDGMCKRYLYSVQKDNQENYSSEQSDFEEQFDE